MPGHALFISIHATHAGGDSTWTAWTACGRHFNPRHPCGWRRHRCSHMLHPSYFNPRHPCGWRRTIRHHLIHAMYFNPRHPCGWRPSCQPPFVRSFGFQSTPPMRVATGRTGGTAEQAGISIHATHAGGDYELRTNRNAGGISIHATHAGGDVTIRECGKGDGLFQSTPPMRVATPAAFRIRTVPGRFQSTPPMRVATLSEFFLAIGQKFQSTPPMRVATETSAPTEPESAISIHATHAGGDLDMIQLQVEPDKDFNPRHPCGWRPPPILTISWTSTFQSTPPMRVATRQKHQQAQQGQISIHATHAGGDLYRSLAEQEGFISIHATHAGGDYNET